jgi:hypothetical protein
VELDATNGCTTCTGGQQCNARGLTAETGTEVICDAGFYCVDATSSVACGRGYYCPANSRAQTVCADGYYQPNLQQSECLECPSGFYCNKVVDGGGTVTTAPEKAEPCPAGKWCGAKTLTPTECGTASNSYQSWYPFVAADTISDCIPTLAGYVIPSSQGTTAAISAMTACSAGSYCPTGGVPVDCGYGHFCPAGSMTPTACPVGTIGTLLNAIGPTSADNTSCTACTQHYYCGTRGTIDSAKVLCGNGFLCGAGSMAASPATSQQGSLCPAG